MTLAETALIGIGFVLELSAAKGCGSLTPTEQTYTPVIETLANKGQTKVGDEVCKLTFPFTTARAGSCKISKSPVMSTFPVTALKLPNPMVANLGFRAIINSEPTVRRSGNDNVLNVG